MAEFRDCAQVLVGKAHGLSASGLRGQEQGRCRGSCEGQMRYLVESQRT